MLLPFSAEGDRKVGAQQTMKPTACIVLALLTLAALPSRGQNAPDRAAQNDESGQLEIGGRSVPYRIRRLPVASFPELPAPIAAELLHRGCMIPQTWQAHGPENVLHASLERPGSADWAALCSVRGSVSLLVFFASAGGQAQVLATAREIDRLQAHGTDGTLGFNWGIDPATPAQIHQAQAGMPHRPALADHDALADSRIDYGSIYRFYANGKWIRLEMP